MTVTPQVFPKETDFEKRRGINKVEPRSGFCQVHVSELKEPLVESRLRLLDSVSKAGVSIDFLKLTPTGLSFLAPQDRSSELKKVLSASKVDFDVSLERSIVMVHAVNVRDEEGMIADLVRLAIASGAPIDHIADGHDRLLFVVPTQFETTLIRAFDPMMPKVGQS